MPKRHPVTRQFISNAQYNKLITQQQRGENLTKGEASKSNPPSPTNEEAEGEEQVALKDSSESTTSNKGEEQVTPKGEDDSESDKSSRHQHFETVSASNKRTTSEQGEEQVTQEDGEQAVTSEEEDESGEQAASYNEDESGEQATSYDEDEDGEQAITYNEGSDDKSTSTSTERAADEEDNMAGESSNNGGNTLPPQTTFIVKDPDEAEADKILKFEIEKVNKVNFSNWKHCLSNHMDLQNCLQVIGYTKEHGDNPEAIELILNHKDWRKQN